MATTISTDKYIVLAYPNGADAATVHNTDTYNGYGQSIAMGEYGDSGSAYQEYMAAKYNVVLTYFIAPRFFKDTQRLDRNIGGMKGIAQTGILRPEMYFLTDGYNGSFSSVEMKPDDVKETVNKQQRVFALVDEFFATTCSLRGSRGRIPQTATALSKTFLCARDSNNYPIDVENDNVDCYYGKVNGVTSGFISGNNGARDLGNAHANYRDGYDKNHLDQMQCRPTMASNFETAASTGASAFQAMKTTATTVFNKAIDLKGLFESFDHLYLVGDAAGADPRDYSGQIIETWGNAATNKETASSVQIARLSHSQAYQYKFFRELVDVDNIEALNHDDSCMEYILPLVDTYPNFERVHDVRMPLSFWVDLTGTNLEGGNIQATGCENIISLGNDQYILNIAFPNIKTGNLKVIVTSGNAGYANLAQPTITHSESNGTLTVTTANANTKAVLFKMVSSEEKEMQVHSRSIVFSVSHEFQVVAGEYRVAVISEMEKMNTAEITVS